MEQRPSPSYTYDKLQNHSFFDLVDVFEDYWMKNILVPCEMLLSYKHGELAAMILLSSYFEAIQIYLSGEDSDRQSKAFFVKGFCCVFSSRNQGIDKVAETIYEHVRCSLAHEGLLHQKVHYSNVGAKAFFLTYPKKPDGNLDIDAEVMSIVVNPQRIYAAIKKHFENYVADLRNTEGNKSNKTAFQKTVDRLWGIGKSENIIGMTEAEFRGNT